MRTRSASQEVLGYVPRPFEEWGGGKNKGEGSLVGDYGKLVLEVAKVSSKVELQSEDSRQK